MKKKTFWQIFLLSVVCILTLFVYGIIAVNANSKAIIRERLKDETELVCLLVHTTSDFNKFSGLSSDESFRITVIDIEGNVLFESDTKAKLENHIDREEIRNALKNKPEAVERFSDTLGYEMTYYALKTELDDGRKIVIRLALKSSRINNYFIITSTVLLIVLFISLGFSVIFSDIISKKITEKIADVGKSLRSLNEGSYLPIKANTDEPELFSIFTEINELNSSVHKYIKSAIAERNKLNTVLENIAQGIIAVDEKKKIILANKSAINIFGSSGAVSDKDLVYLVDDLNLCNIISAHFDENYTTEYFYKNKEYSVVIKNADGVNKGENACSIVIFTDITKEREIARQKNDFFANASHELKTPVAVMQGLSELLLAKDLDDGSKKQVDRIHKESMRLASLISDMLELSRLENGEKYDVIKSKINIREIVEEVINELSSKIAEKGIIATITGEATIYGDYKRIYELVENLCSNAVNYNKYKGEIEVKIEDDDDTVKLKVLDTGIGIEKVNLPRLCERFYRVDKSRSKKTGGTGLGLAIVKHVCALHNATLAIDSDLGIGTTVTIVFKKE